MRNLSFVLIALLLSLNFSFSQNNYGVDYSYKDLNSNCNVFSSELIVSNIKHQTTKGFPTFDAANYFVKLNCKRTGSSSFTGTEYQILFPFKKNYRYQIKLEYKGSVSSSNEVYPQVALKLNTTKKAHNKSTSCTGPQTVQTSDYSAFSASGSGLAWAKNNIIDETLTSDCESLSIAAFPWAGNGSSSTGTQTISIRKIQIIEIPPAVNAITAVTKTSSGSSYGVEDGELVNIRADYTLVTAIPESDLAFDWRLIDKFGSHTPKYFQLRYLYPNNVQWFYSISNGPRTINLGAGLGDDYYDYDNFEVQVQVRMKQISTSTYLTDWFTSHSFYMWW